MSEIVEVQCFQNKHLANVQGGCSAGNLEVLPYLAVLNF